MAFTVLVINIGSSSIKYAVYSDENLMINGYLQRVTDFRAGLKKVLAHVEKENIKLDAVGHRVVHGGVIEDPIILTKSRLKKIEAVKELAPLHDPFEIQGIKICMKLFNVPNMAVFDTSFHQTIPEQAYTYAIPSGLSKRYNIRRYGFHGISHEYVSSEAAKLLRKPLNKLKVITCHLGNGCSVAAVDKGKSVETSMGFTPLEGLVMGTRSGDIDPAIVTFLQKRGFSSTGIYNLLNRKSGLLGLSGHSNDIRDLLDSSSTKAKMAVEVFCHRLVKYIGAYAAVMDGIDSIVFTAGIGENAWQIRKKVLERFGFLGVKIDSKKNRKNELVISEKSSKVKVFAIPTNESLLIARKAKRLVDR